jgi:hypothetical protein
MTILYRIKPADKKSVEAFYDVYKKMPDGKTIPLTKDEMENLKNNNLKYISN